MVVKEKSIKNEEVVILEETVYMGEDEAGAILEQFKLLTDLSPKIEDIDALDWMFLYDLEYEDKVIGFTLENEIGLNERQVDVVQTDKGYAFNLWKKDYFYGQIHFNNSWELIDAIH